ncbi:MAG: hypothetical protein IPO36_01930 [Anaerolineales bacterium]|nr:hypothetical protein [Anaerolineales bacterium]
MEKHHNINVEDFLAYVHDLPLGNYLTPNPIQRDIIASLPTRNLIFTNADIPHAERAPPRSTCATCSPTSWM